MQYRWQFTQVLSFADRHGVLAKILARRQIPADQLDEFLEPELYVPTPPRALPGMAAAVERILAAQQHQEKVVVYGDFDCDGVTATAVLVEALAAIGVSVTYCIPHRTLEGHGLHNDRVQTLASQGTKLIITCDCGVGDREAIALAQQLGMEVIVTDHHSLPESLPDCIAVINPLLLPLEHPLRYLSGVAVAYKLAEALWHQAESLLDLVAIGLIADVVVLLRENRYLVYRGLEALRSTSRPGLQHLLRDVKKISAKAISHRLAPCLNAIGRLEEASLAVELLQTTDRERGIALASKLEKVNETRRELTKTCFEQAEVLLAEQIDRPRAIVLHDPSWHSGIVGIVASQLQEQYQCPVILIASNGHGSARSWGKVDLVKIFARIGDLFQRSGGHPKAGGFIVLPENVPIVIDRLRIFLEQAMLNQQQQKILPIEAVFPLTKETTARDLEELYQQIMRLEPFGEGNPNPVFAIANIAVTKNSPEIDFSGEHLCFTILGKKFWWYGASAKEKQLKRWQKVDIAFQFAPDSRAMWKGEVLDVRRSIRRSVARAALLTVQVIDARQNLVNIPDECTFYQEDTSKLTDRGALYLAQIPYGSLHLQAILRQLQPSILYLGGQVAPWLDKFLPEISELPLLLHQQWQFHHLYQHQPIVAWQEIIAEVRSFQEWFVTAPIEAITLLCERLGGGKVNDR